MFFLGAGFMLIETKAVVQMALLFGGTWMVNSIVFCAVLTMILMANLFVLAVRPRSLTPFYVGLALSLAASAVVPLDAFLGLSRALQIAGSCALAFTPVLFAGVVFAMSFSQAVDADRHSARTSPERWSADCPNTARCCSASSTLSSWRWVSTSSPRSARCRNRSRGRPNAGGIARLWRDQTSAC